MSNENIRKLFGFVSLVGKPNVGKSTLMNALFNQSISITTLKPQTTRNLIEAVYNDDDSQIIFIDTPGYHHAKTRLDEQLNIQSKKSVQIADVICFLTDVSRELDDEDIELMDYIKANKSPDAKVFLVVSKSDTKKELDEINERIQACLQHMHFDEHLMISALHKINLEKLFRLIKANLKMEVPMYNVDQNGSLLPDSFNISEIVREQCLKNLRQEIPYGVAVIVEEDKYDAHKNVYLISASIVVEKESQKPIVIGNKGQMIKKIGIAAREELLKIYDCKINLDLRVRVEKDWRNNQTKLKEFGYWE